MKKYLLSVYQPDGDPPPPEVLAKIMSDLDDLRQELEVAGAWVFAAGLSPPSTAKVVHVKNAKAFMTDGPFIESKEHIGGFTVIQAPDLAAALEWGRKAAVATTLPIEVRAFRD
jgi:hypothetical protein